jgi:hypothetical protein
MKPLKNGKRPLNGGGHVPIYKKNYRAKVNYDETEHSNTRNKNFVGCNNPKEKFEFIGVNHLYCPCCNKESFSQLRRINRRNIRHSAKSEINQQLDEMDLINSIEEKELKEQIEKEEKWLKDWQDAEQKRIEGEIFEKEWQMEYEREMEENSNYSDTIYFEEYAYFH